MRDVATVELLGKLRESAARNIALIVLDDPDTRANLAILHAADRAIQILNGNIPVATELTLSIDAENNTDSNGD